MGFFIFLVVILLAITVVCNQAATTTVVRCGSVSCSHNSGGRCTKTTISVYDNTVKGLCLDHTEKMHKRIIEPMIQKGLKFNITVDSSIETPTIIANNLNPWTSRKDKLDWWLN